MPDQPTIINQRVHRPPATSTWQHEHRWGKGFGDSTTLYVDRTDGGSLKIRYGNEAIEIRRDLVQVLADMVASAATWSDSTAPGNETEADR